MTTEPELTTRLDQLEIEIRAGVKTFIGVGNALAEIMEEQLYKQRGYGSFAEYCEKVWGFKKSYAYQLVDAAALIKSAPELSTMVENPRQARELAKVAPENRVQVMKAAGDKPTAKAIRQAAKVTLAEASEPTSRYVTPEEDNEAEAALTQPQSPALRGIDVAKLDKVELTETAKAVIESAEITMSDLAFLVGELQGGQKIDCSQLKQIRAQANKTVRWLMALEAEACG